MVPYCGDDAREDNLINLDKCFQLVLFLLFLDNVIFVIFRLCYFFVISRLCYLHYFQMMLFLLISACVRYRGE